MIRTEVAIAFSEPALTRTEYDGASKVVHRMLSSVKAGFWGVMIDEFGRFSCRQSSNASICVGLVESAVAPTRADPHMQAISQAVSDLEVAKNDILFVIEQEIWDIAPRETAYPDTLGKNESWL